MTKSLAKAAFGWGLGLWLIGYVLGVAMFFVVPAALIGWVLTPIALVITIWVLATRIDGPSLGFYAAVAVIWALLAVVLDYVFIVRLLHPADGYYKADVFIYYAAMLVLPLAAGWWKTRKAAQAK
jgi:hypothetical protein